MNTRPRKKQSTELAVIPTSTEVALPSGLEDAARDLARKSRAPRTLEAYALHWRMFAAWCDDHGRQALPANIKTVGGYITWLSQGGSGRQLAISTIQIKMAAISYYHNLQGFALDLTHPDIATIWGGIRRSIAAKRVVRQAAPLEFGVLREILDARRPDVIRDVLDSAILALGCVVGLRRSELVGLDYQELGTTEDKHRRGFLKIDADGMEVVLMTSKASQDRAETIPIKRSYAPTICTVIEEWVAAAKLEPGMPLFLAPGDGHGWSTCPQSPYKGVSWDRGADKWRAQVWLNGKSQRKGLFADPHEAHLAWAKAKGTPPQGKGMGLTAGRLSAEAVPRAVRRRLDALFACQAKKRGGFEKLTRAQITERLRQYSGHSLRAGCATSLARAGVSVHRIMDITRHKRLETVTRYVRFVEKREESGLKGVAF